MTANLSRKRIAGMTLIELMVALAIGSFLMIGAMTVFMQSRTTFRINESISRLQENARFVMDTLEPDLRMASYFGLTTRSSKVDNRANPAQPTPPGLAVVGDCGPNWTINLGQEVAGTNNVYAWACPAFGAPQPNSDTLEIRRVSEDPIGLLQIGTMYLQSARFRNGQIFVGNVIPPGFQPAPQSMPFLVRVSGYYVSQNSSLDTPGNPIPSLRQKVLVGGGFLGPRIIDQEVLPGVEDFQVQLGVDTDLEGTPTRGSVNRYVNANDPILNPLAAGFIPDAEVLSIRFWIRIRSERPEVGYTDTNNYVYADVNIPAPNDQFRRTVVTKTIYLRNARKAS